MGIPVTDSEKAEALAESRDLVTGDNEPPDKAVIKMFVDVMRAYSSVPTSETKLTNTVEVEAAICGLKIGRHQGQIGYRMGP